MIPRRSAFLMSAALALASPSPASAAEIATVFRCVEPGGRVLYTDVACRNADVVELHPGKADPAATQRLAQAQATLDAGMQRLRAGEAREAERRVALADAQTLAWAAQPPVPTPTADFWPVYGGFVGPVRSWPHPPKHGGVSKPRPPSGGKGAPPPRPVPMPR